MRFVGSIVGIGLLLASARLARAADPEPQAQSVDDLDLVKLLNVKVSTATKTSESLAEAPAVISVVTREDIHRWGYRSLAEVLSHCVGFYIVDDHVMPSAAVRGTNGGLGSESGNIKVMIDGRSVAYRTTSGNWLGVALIPLESVKQIEIIRGPASALYGADAFLGVVNIITDPPDAMRPVRLRTMLGTSGSNPSGQLDMVTGHQVGRFDFMFGAAGEQGSRSGLALPSESPAPTLPTYVGARRVTNNLDRRSLVLQGRVGYRVPGTGQLVASAYLSGLERGGDFAHWAQLTNDVDPNGRKLGTVIGLQQMRLNLDGLVHVTDTLDLTAQTTYFRGGLLPSDRIEVGSGLFYVRRHTSYEGHDSVVEARYTPSAHFNLIAGLEGVYDHESFGAPQRFNRTDDRPVLTTGSSDRTFDLVNLGAFVSSNLKVIDPWLKLTGGARYDRHSLYGDQVTGRVGATSRLARTVVAKLLYGSSFKAPSPYLLYAAPLRPGDVEGNPRLDPQHAHTIEYQMAWQPSAFFNVSSDVAYTILEDKAEFTPQGINQAARNVARQRSLSWETRAEVRHYSDYSGYLSAELVKSVRDLGQEGYAADVVGSAVPVYPPYILRGGFTMALPSPASVPLQLGGQGMLVGPRRAADTSVVESGGTFDLAPYVTVNAFVSTGDIYLLPGHESRIAIRAKNLTGTLGPDPGSSGFEYPLPPREVFLELQHVY